MIHWNQLVTGITTGITAIIFGLTPGLPQALVEGFLKLSDSLPIRKFPFVRQSGSLALIPQPREFKILGLAIIAVTLVAFLAA